MIESAYNANLFLNHFRSYWGYWTPLVSIEEKGPFPVHVYSYTNGPCRSIWFACNTDLRLAILKSVLSWSSYYLYEFSVNGYSYEMEFSCVLNSWLRCVEKFWERQNRRKLGIGGGDAG
jgi:hypothetical protein